MARTLFILLFIVMLQLLVGLSPALAHHILGRPAYHFGEDSSTPPSISLETQIGQYVVNVMVFPAFPKPGEESRIKFYAIHLKTKETLSVPIQFLIRDDVWFGDKRLESLGEQRPIDGIYRQSVIFKEEANYILTAQFEALNEPYTIDIPLTIGNPTSSWPLFIAAGVVGGMLLLLVWHKKRRRRHQPLASMDTDLTEPS
ncbi:MAG: hypothetical protein H7832_02040 [Magnetococcus sp. DMHC-6]